MSNTCSDCHEEPGPGSVARLVGTDYAGNALTLCSRCWIIRDRDARAPAAPPAKGKRR